MGKRENGSVAKIRSIWVGAYFVHGSVGTCGGSFGSCPKGVLQAPGSIGPLVPWFCGDLWRFLRELPKGCPPGSIGPLVHWSIGPWTHGQARGCFLIEILNCDGVHFQWTMGCIFSGSGFANKPQNGRTDGETDPFSRFVSLMGVAT